MQETKEHAQKISNFTLVFRDIPERDGFDLVNVLCAIEDLIKAEPNLAQYYMGVKESWDRPKTDIFDGFFPPLPLVEYGYQVGRDHDTGEIIEDARWPVMNGASPRFLNREPINTKLIPRLFDSIKRFRYCLSVKRTLRHSKTLTRSREVNNYWFG